MSGIFEGASQFINAPFELQSEQSASNRQYQREQAQADAAIQGAQDKGAYESGKARILSASTAAKQKVAYANSGVDPTSGTAADVQADTSALGELDAQTLAIKAAREVYGYQEGKKQSKEEWYARKGNMERKFASAELGGLAKFAASGGSLGAG